jgi:hypothetical protein
MTTTPTSLPTTVREAWELACPNCGSDEHIEIEITCTALLTADGTDTSAASEGGHYWEKQSPCRCDACNHEATVADFSTDEEHG